MWAIGLGFICLAVALLLSGCGPTPAPAQAPAEPAATEAPVETEAPAVYDVTSVCQGAQIQSEVRVAIATFLDPQGREQSCPRQDESSISTISQDLWVYACTICNLTGLDGYTGETVWIGSQAASCEDACLASMIDDPTP